MDGKDMIVVAANLQKIIDNPPDSKSRTFALVSQLPKKPVLLRVEVIGIGCSQT